MEAGRVGDKEDVYKDVGLYEYNQNLVEHTTGNQCLSMNEISWIYVQK